MRRNILLFFCCVFCLFETLEAQLRLAKIFSSDMIFQCDTPVSIWGWADANTAVNIAFKGKEYRIKSDKKGYWKQQLSITSAGGPYEISVSSNTQKINLTNILFGDVWLCGGQSNMEWFVENSKDSEEEIANASYPTIRLLEIPHKMATLPQEDFESGEWAICSSKTIPQFSAVAYFFGKNLQNKVDKPIGLINNNYGGTVVEAWTSAASLSDLSVYKKQIEDFNAIEDLEVEKNKGEAKFSKWIAKFKSMDKGMQGDEFAFANPTYNFSNWEKISVPGAWETTGIKTLENVDGVVWLSREFEIENLAATSKIILSLGAIDDSDKTWINGKLVGETYNRFNKDRFYNIPQGVLRSGKNRIVIRVEDYVGGGGLAGTDDKVFLEIGETKIGLAGIWKYHIGMIPATPFDASNFGPNNFPTCLYNGMIAPMIDFPIKGVIWYQGETNTYRAHEYRHLFQRWIKDWRKQWKNDKLPILFVQLANYTNEEKLPEDSQWAELREAQTMALSLPHTAMISAIDIGEAKSIHPINKQEVGRRLSLAAQKEVYGMMEVNYKGASYSEMKKEGKFIDLSFKDTYKGLKVTDKFSYVFGFSIAGKDQKFHWAKAEIISANMIRVWSDEVDDPEAVRYSWQDNPEPANVFNSENFPLLPFRTDDWTLSTLGIVRE